MKSILAIPSLIRPNYLISDPTVVAEAQTTYSLKSNLFDFRIYKSYNSLTTKQKQKKPT